MVVYDMATKQTLASVPLSRIRAAASDARFVDRSLKLDGETTSVRISHDSRYALISNAPDVRLHVFWLVHTC